MSSLNIFDVLKHLNEKDISFYDGLSDKEKKEIVPLVLMRWLSGSSNPYQIIVLNELVNPYVFPLAQDKKLLWNLLTVSTSGSFQRYTWSKINYGENSGISHSIKCIQKYFNYSTRRAKQVIHLVDSEDIIKMAEELGYQLNELQELKKELGYEVKVSKPKKTKTKLQSSDHDGVIDIMDF